MSNNSISIKIPSHPYVLINRTVLCNYGIEVEDNFLLDSIAACSWQTVRLDNVFYS